MILAIDIGNSFIVAGCAEQDTVLFTERISSDTRRTALEYAFHLKFILELHSIPLQALSGSILSSVVSVLTPVLQEALKKLTGEEPLTVGPGIKTGLKIMIDNPAQLGSDLVAGAVAAISRFPLPAIVINLGAATTFSVINRAGQYIGGAIAPGIRLSLDALSRNTSELPHISLAVPKHVIGTNTVCCMQSGAVLGTASMIDGMADRFEAELGEKACLVATGDAARIVISCCRHSVRLDEDLVMHGLSIIYRKNEALLSRTAERSKTSLSESAVNGTDSGI